MKYLAFAIVLSTVLLSSCVQAYDTTYLDQQKADMWQRQPEPYIAGDIDVTNAIMQRVAIYPDTITITDGQPQRIIDTWQKDDENGLYKKGDYICLYITNNYRDETTFDILVSTSTSGRCETAGVYNISRADNYVLDWLVVKDRHPVIPPGKVMAVPVGLVISDMPVPQKWEIRIMARPQGMISAAGVQRWLIVMVPHWYDPYLIPAAIMIATIMLLVLLFTFKKLNRKNVK